MTNPWQIFLQSLGEDDQTEYGDFKREMDAQLRHLVETSPPMSQAQQHTIVKIREDFLWTDHPDEDIDLIKQEIQRRILRTVPASAAANYSPPTPNSWP